MQLSILFVIPLLFCFLSAHRLFHLASNVMLRSTSKLRFCKEHYGTLCNRALLFIVCGYQYHVFDVMDLFICCQSASCLRFPSGHMTKGVKNTPVKTLSRSTLEQEKVFECGAGWWIWEKKQTGRKCLEKERL